MSKSRFAALLGIVVAAALFRLIPHPPNFTPLAAMCLFGGAYIKDKRIAALVVFAAMILSDFFIGFHSTLPVVYLSLAMILCLGFWLQKRKQVMPIAVATLLSSTLFFIVTNFGVWLIQGMYPMTLEGLLVCYTAAIPFFHNTLAGDVFYVAVLFGVFALLERKYSAIRELEVARSLA